MLIYLYLIVTFVCVAQQSNSVLMAWDVLSLLLSWSKEIYTTDTIIVGIHCPGTI